MQLSSVTGVQIRRMSRRERSALFHVVCEELTDTLVERCFAIVKDYPSAQDLTQEVLLKLCTEFRKPESLNGPLIPWLWRVAFNDSLNHLNQRRSESISCIDDDLMTCNGPLEIIVQEERYAEVMAQAAALPEKQREAFQAVFIDGYSNREAAERLGCSRENMRKNLSRGVQRLREFLSDD